MPIVFVCLSAGYNITHLGADESKALFIKNLKTETHPHTDTCMHSGTLSSDYQKRINKINKKPSTPG